MAGDLISDRYGIGLAVKTCSISIIKIMLQLESFRIFILKFKPTS